MTKIRNFTSLVHLTLLFDSEDVKDPSKWEPAVKAAQHAVTMDPSNATALGILGSLLASHGHTDEALSCLDRALDLEPNHSWALQQLGRVRYRTGEVVAAQEAFVRLSSAGPGFEGASIAGQVLALRSQGAASEADALLSEFDSQYLSGARTLLDIGRAFVEMGALDDAAKSFRMAVRLRPGFADAHNELAWHLADRLGTDLELATTHAELAVQLNRVPEALGHYVDTLGWVWYKRGELDRALGHLKEAAARCELDMVIRKHNEVVEQEIAEKR